MPIEYEIVNDDRIGTVKRSVALRVADRTTADDIERIANEIHALDANKYDHTFIGMYLPRQTINAGCWATAHANPNLEVTILGMAVEQIAEFQTRISNDDRTVVGHWVDDSPNVAHAITIYERQGNFLMECSYSDGSSTTNEMNRTEINDGVHFTRQDKPDSGDYWLVKPDGGMETRDADGTISSPQRLRGTNE